MFLSGGKDQDKSLITIREKLYASAAYVANTVLAGGAILSGVVFLYIVYLSTSGKQYSTLVAVFLYVFPVALAAVCLACLRLPPSYRINVAVFGVSTLASIYVVESIATTWFSLPTVVAEVREKTIIEVAKELGLNVDARTRLAVIADLRRKGIDAYPTFAPITLLTTKKNSNPNIGAGSEFLPLAGISNKVSVVCNESGEYMIYENDEHGFHNPTGVWTTGRVDIAAVGDSFVQGFCVPSDKNFVALIRNRYPSILNLGTAGQGPLMMLATIKEYAQAVRPSVVLWFHDEANSLDFLKKERDSPLLMRYFSTGFSQGLLERQAEIDRELATYAEAEMKGGSSRKLEEVYEKIREPSRLLPQIQQILKLRQVRQAFGLVSESDHIRSNEAMPNYLTPDVKDLFVQVLLEARTSVNLWGGKVYFVYLPTWRTNWSITKEGKNEILNLAITLGFSIIDLDRVFQAQSDPLALFALRMAAHYNEDGHRLVAETILKSIPMGLRSASPECCDREEPAS